MLSYKMDFSSYRIVPGFGKSSHIWLIFYNSSFCTRNICTVSSDHSRARIQGRPKVELFYSCDNCMLATNANLC